MFRNSVLYKILLEKSLHIPKFDEFMSVAPIHIILCSVGTGDIVTLSLAHDYRFSESARSARFTEVKIMCNCILFRDSEAFH